VSWCGFFDVLQVLQTKSKLTIIGIIDEKYMALRDLV
jgi:hypothetical protein